MIHAPPPTAMLLFDLLKKALAPKQIPPKAKIDKNDPKQNNNVVAGFQLPTLSGLLFLAIAKAIPSEATAAAVIAKYIITIVKSKKQYWVLITVFLFVGVDKT